MEFFDHRLLYKNPPVSALPPRYLTVRGHHYGMAKMQERARKAAVEHQPKRAVQEVQASCGGKVDQEGAAEGSGQKGSDDRPSLLVEAKKNRRFQQAFRQHRRHHVSTGRKGSDFRRFGGSQFEQNGPLGNTSPLSPLLAQPPITELLLLGTRSVRTSN